MEIVGTIIKSLPGANGIGSKGPWQKRSFLIQTMTQYPKEVAIDVWNDKGEILKSLKKGQEVRVQIEIASKEYNGKYRTEVTAYKIEPVSDTPVAAPKAQPKSQRQYVPDDSSERAWEDSEGDLPF